MPMIELNGPRIHAIPYRNRRPLKARRIPSGAIVEAPDREQRGQVPENLSAFSEGTEGLFARLSGVFLLPDGDVAAVYGAEPETIG